MIGGRLRKMARDRDDPLPLTTLFAHARPYLIITAACVRETQSYLPTVKISRLRVADIGVLDLDRCRHPHWRPSDKHCDRQLSPPSGHARTVNL